MTFTDDDLKHWKSIDAPERWEKLPALLARLEAAEKVIGCAIDCYEVGGKVVADWRKTKGE